MRKRSWAVYSVFALLFIALIVHLYIIIKTKPAQVASSHNRWTITVSTSRGTIYDTNLLPFVNERKEYSAAIAPSESLLAHVYPACTQEDFSVLRDTLSSGVPAAVKLQQPIGFMDGLKLFLTPVRYDQQLLAPHVLGYLDSGGQNGICGIEKAYNDLLSSYNGKATASFFTDGNGAYLAGIMPESSDTTARSIGGVVLTLDKEIQTIIEDTACQHLEKGAVIVLESQTGSILGMASFPSFQPDTVSQSVSLNNGALLNRALSLYDCGSVFKIITTAAALETGVPEQTEFLCEGHYTVQGTTFHCHNRLGHGQLNMSDAFAQSCNIYYIKLAQQIGGGALYSMADNFGFGRSITLTDSLNANTPLLPQLSSLTNNSAALANFSFGQGYLMATPLHIAQMVTALTNDGTMPSINLVKGVVDENKHYISAEQGREYHVISSNTASALRKMMEKTVSEGTGQAAVPTLTTAAGKTGTAETGQLIDGNPVSQSWFVGYFPADEPRYVVVVLAENADRTNVKSTEIFKEIADKIISR